MLVPGRRTYYSTGTPAERSEVFAAAGRALLFADRAFSTRPLPRDLDLTAGSQDVRERAGTPLLTPPVLLIANPPLPAAAASSRVMRLSAAAALALHILILVLFVVRLSDSGRELGAEEGLPDNFNVAVVSEADLKRLSSDLVRQEGRAVPMPGSVAVDQPSPEPPAPAVTPATQQEAAATPPPQPEKLEKRETQFDPSGFIARASQQFSAQLNQAFDAAQRHQQAQKSSTGGGAVRVSKPGGAHSGKAGDFDRAVYWALAATPPMGNGKWGSTVVTFTVSAAGKPDGLRLVKGSGDSWLDQGALLAVRQAKLPVPPTGLEPGDRTFVVEYISTERRY